MQAYTSKVKLRAILALAVGASSPCWADGDSRSVLSDLQTLLHRGIAIDRAKIEGSDAALSACVREYQPLRDKAKALESKSRLLEGGSSTMYLNLAAGEVFRCLYCNGSGKPCSEAKQDLQRAEQYMAEEEAIAEKPPH
jgi:hypothetical protein